MKVGRYAIDAEPVVGGLRFTFAAAPGVEPSLRQLIELEAECCEWMTIRLDRLQDRLQMSVTGIGDDGEQAARESFAPLAELVSGRPSAARP